jgi:hypothetical protein
VGLGTPGLRVFLIGSVVEAWGAGLADVEAVAVTCTAVGALASVTEVITPAGAAVVVVAVVVAGAGAVVAGAVVAGVAVAGVAVAGAGAVVAGVDVVIEAELVIVARREVVDAVLRLRCI